MANYTISHRRQNAALEDRYKVDARSGGKGKTQQGCCNMNDVYVCDTSEQLHWLLSVFRYNAKEVRSVLSASSPRSSDTPKIRK